MAGCPHLKDNSFVILHKPSVKQSEKVIALSSFYAKERLPMQQVLL